MYSLSRVPCEVGCELQSRLQGDLPDAALPRRFQGELPGAAMIGELQVGPPGGPPGELRR